MNKSFSVAVAQFNFLVGDLTANADAIIDAIDKARAAGADLLITPELALSGYPPEDLLLRPSFYQDCAVEFTRVMAAAKGICVVLGYPLWQGGKTFNAASVLLNGRCLETYYKEALPNSEVFDERRYFNNGYKPCVFELNGVQIGINICEDIWQVEPVKLAYEAGAEVLLVLNASPFHANKQKQRYGLLRKRIETYEMPLLYCNMVGGQDELVFDGGSFALNGDGRLAYQAPCFEVALDIVQFANGAWVGEINAIDMTLEAQVYQALVLGVRDYVRKNGFKGALIGLSGGVDSALTLAIAADALGADKVHAVMLPSPYTAQMSFDDSREMVKRLGVRYTEIPISPAMDVMMDLLAPQLAGTVEDVTEENLQSRIRGVLLMALSNKTGSIVLTTGNKSEMATGYSTLYGDMAGGFAVLKDVYKTLVYKLALWRNRQEEVIPSNVISRPPSAELKPNQTDQDSLPPYPVLDAILEAYIEHSLSVREIIFQGFDRALVKRTINLLKRSEYKRRQAPVGVRVTRRAFGKDWRYPITAQYREAL